MTMKPRITLTRGFAGRYRWTCTGLHPNQFAEFPMVGYGPTPAAAYANWINSWEIPF
jgi:hypothetical protein